MKQIKGPTNRQKMGRRKSRDKQKGRSSKNSRKPVHQSDKMEGISIAACSYVAINVAWLSVYFLLKLTNTDVKTSGHGITMCRG